MKVSCEIIADLLPLYYDDVCSRASREFVKEHLKDCENCKNMLNEIKESTIEARLLNEKDDVLTRHMRAIKMEKRLILGVLAAVVMFFGFMAFTHLFSYTLPEQPRYLESGERRGISVGAQWEPFSIAPGRHNNRASSYINTMNYNGLFRICSETLMPVPDLVYSWHGVSDTVFEFTLHEGVLFHNGERLSAHDVVASWNYVRNYPYAAHVHERIMHFEAMDDLVVRIDTLEPHALLFDDLAHTGNMIMPRSLIEAGNDFGANPVGSGPFASTGTRLGYGMRHLAFEDYFDASRAPRLEYVNLRLIHDPLPRGIALESGEIDFDIYLTRSTINRYIVHPDIEVAIVPGTAHHKLILNHEAPQFQNPYVRRAIGMAIDKEAAIMAAELSEPATPTWSQTPILFEGSNTFATYGFDPEGARELLREHGIDPADLSFTIIANTEARLRMGVVFQSNLADIGIGVHVRMAPPTDTLHLPFEAIFGGFSSPTFLGYVRGVFSGENIGGSNRAYFRNAEVDELINRAMVTLDQTARIAIYHEISRTLNESVPHIPTHMSMIARAFNSNLIVPEVSPAGLHFNMMHWAQ